MGPVQLADPLEGPAGHDGLGARVVRGRVVKAPLGTGLGVTACPGGRVERKDVRPLLGPVINEETPQLFFVDPTTRQGLIERAVTTTKLWLQTQCRHAVDAVR